MVLLTITPTARSAIQLYNHLCTAPSEVPSTEPSLAEPVVGAPVSHAQLIEVSRYLRQHASAQDSGDLIFRLDSLLKGANVYVPPPKPKPQPTAEYAALMARLRQEEERREYERMINPPPPETSFVGSHTPAKDEEDEVTYADVNRQLALIINVLVSIIACSVAIWIAARHWSVPQRLGLSMSGSGLVAIAEVAIYSGYIHRIKEAKQHEAKQAETKQVVETWVIEKKDAKGDTDTIRYRKGKHR